MNLKENDLLTKKDLVNILNKELQENNYSLKVTIIEYIKKKQKQIFSEIDKLIKESQGLGLDSESARKWKRISEELTRKYKQIDRLSEFFNNLI